MTLEILTPSYARDFELCRDLAASVRRFAPEGTRHTIVVPPSDVRLFTLLQSDHVRIRTTSEFLPRSLLRMPSLNVWLNLKAPWPPVRGWIAQQLVKLSAVAESSAHAVLVVDSDLEFIRPFSLETYAPDGAIPLYRLDGAVTADLPRHMVWDDVAHRLIGVAVRRAASRPDFICWPCLWEPRRVRELLTHVELVHGRGWASIVARELHFSEMVLYGAFIESIVAATESVAVTEDMHCRSFSDETALDEDALHEFLARVRPSDVAVMISAKSGTDLDRRRRALASIRAV
jgi:hypothetical protein